MSLLYTAGMYLNDAFDRAIDARERPGRPIPSGAAAAGTVFGAGFAMLAGGVLLLALVDLRAGLAGLGLAAVILLYDLFHKGHPWSPVLMGACRALVYVTAALAVTARPSPAVLAAALALWSYTIGLSFVARQETLARFTAWWPLVLLVVPAVRLLPVAAADPLVLGTLVAFLAWTVWALSWLVRGRGRSVPRAVTALIAGMALHDAVLLATTPEAAWVPVALACFLLTVHWQRHVPGT
jgi:4-hydroxybenzoate polyprenyltransferase